MILRVGFAVLWLLTASASAEDWPSWRGPLGNGTAPRSPRLIEKLPANGLAPAWITRDIPAAGWGSPVVADGRVYLLTHSRKQKPESEFPPREFPELTKEQREQMSPEEIDGYEKSRAEEERERRRQDTLTETLWCLDADQGAVLWKAAVDSVHTSMPHSNTPAVHGGRVYLLGAGLKSRCFQAETGNLLWLTTLPGEFNDQHVDSSFAIADGLAVILAGKLFALDEKTGEILWSAENSSGRQSSPVIWNGEAGKLVIANVGGGKTAAFELKTGQEVWRVESLASLSTPVISGNRMVTFGDQPQAGLRCFEISNDSARQLWVVKGVADKGSSPVIVGEHVFAQAERKLVCVQLQSGKQEWQFRLALANPQYTSLLAADGKLFYTHDGVLCVAASPGKHEVLFAGKISHPGVLAEEGTHRRLLHLSELEAQDGGSSKARKTYEDEVLSQGPLDCASPAFANGRLFVRLKNGLACYDLRHIETATTEPSPRR